MYQDDPLVAGICAAADAALAPVFAVLDNYASYLDPATAPADTLHWLASWIGATLPDTAEPGPRRKALQRTAEHLGRHGTTHGIRTALATIHGLEVDIEEPGATAWTLDPDKPAHRPVHFRVTADSDVDLRTVDGLLGQLKPAHIRHTTELVPGPAIPHASI
jgi:phage tail-like protein